MEILAGVIIVRMAEKEPEKSPSLEAFMRSIERKAVPLEPYVQTELDRQVEPGMIRDPDGTINFDSEHGYTQNPLRQNLSKGPLNPNNN